MGIKRIPSVTIYSCDHCGREEEKKWTAGDGWWHHTICNECLPEFKKWVNQR